MSVIPRGCLISITLSNMIGDWMDVLGSSCHESIMLLAYRDTIAEMSL